ncbi:MAG: PilT/PilU family type 4a pilus ATPase [Fibrobacteres bacterium]|nr:PilT/PilU family type 4a pilus ATPase [Fibrobacterota bacterium]
MIDNQLAANLLLSHQLASREQILSVWPQVSAEKDVALLLVEIGVLPEPTYYELRTYLESIQAPAPAAMAIEPDSGPGLPAEPIVQRDPSITDVVEENWIPVAEDVQPEARKTSRAEHEMRKRAAESAHLPAPEKTVPNAPAASLPASPASAQSHSAAPPLSAAPSPATARLVREDRPAADGPRVDAPASIGPGSSWGELLAYARQQHAADLHLSAGNPIMLRRYGALQAVSAEPLSQTSIRGWVESALGGEQFLAFEDKGDLEFIYTLPHHGRYRVTLLKQRRGWDVTARVIPDRIRSMEEAGLPESCRELTKWAQGLVLVTGPVGCGKTSTLATLVDIVNSERHDHIITIEEPIEIIYPPSNCRITQRQIGPHTLSHDAALRAALREDPDIIVISELRDLDTIRVAVSAAETGHLVFGTMNTTNATRTLNRLIDSFPPEEQGIVRNMISESLRGVISQQLLPRTDGEGMLPAFEVLTVTTAVANMIRKDEVHQLGTAMLTGKTAGMILLDDSLRYLVDRGLVNPAEAMCRATNPKDFEKYLGRR